jgi:hypothetical protein
MSRLALLAVFCATLALGFFKPAPELQVLEMDVHREEGLIQLAAKVKNVTEKPLDGLNIIFQFQDGEGKTITTQRAVADEPKLAPDAVSNLEGQMKDAPEAVAMRVLAETKSGRQLRVGNNGPFPIQ